MLSFLTAPPITSKSAFDNMASLMDISIIFCRPLEFAFEVPSSYAEFGDCSIVNLDITPVGKALRETKWIIYTEPIDYWIIKDELDKFVSDILTDNFGLKFTYITNYPIDIEGEFLLTYDVYDHTMKINDDCLARLLNPENDSRQRNEHIFNSFVGNKYTAVICTWSRDAYLEP